VAIFREVVNKRKNGCIFVLFLEDVGGKRSEFMLGKNKQNSFCCFINVQFKMPHGTQDCNGCPYPLSHMELFCKGNRKTKYFYLIVRSILILTISALNTDCYIHKKF
jgi:hypothetical protein